MTASALRWGGRAMLGGALALSLYAGWGTESGAPLAGCGPGSGCGEVLQSHWSRVLDMPVAWLGGAVYLGLILLSIGAPLGGLRWTGILSLGALTVLAAGWFTGVQALMLRAFCPLCLATHTLAVLGAVTLLWGVWRENPPSEAATTSVLRRQHWPALFAAVLATAALAVTQWRTPPREYVLVQLPETAGAIVVNRGTSRLLSLHEGRFVFDLEKSPRLGSASASRWLVCHFTYTCPHCRELHGALQKLVDGSGGQLAVLLVPVPLERGCNPSVELTRRQHEHSCHYALVAWALAQLDHDAFRRFDEWLFASELKPDPGAVLRKAEELSPAFVRRTSDWQTEANQRLVAGIEAWAANNAFTTRSELPQLQEGRRLIIGTAPLETIRSRLLDGP
jgi:uncharacterized membrane protein